MFLLNTLPGSGKEPSLLCCDVIQTMAFVTRVGSMSTMSPFRAMDCTKHLVTNAVNLWSEHAYTGAH